jgi:L-lysine epsilon oxidase-like protein
MTLTYRIHPAIGIARVGDSPEDFFIGPEAPGVPASLTRPDRPGPQDGKYKDAEQRVKRQGARFRIYEYTLNDTGVATKVREITAAEGRIEWDVHLVNRKAASHRFPEGGPRNEGVPPAKLIIDAKAQTITGRDQPMKRMQGRFMDAIDVPLGDLLTDSSGRLIVLGGFGKSQPFPAGRHADPSDDFANRKGWCDDTSDGPVRATVRLNDSAKAVEADSAWVIVGPPDFAPPIENVVTLYDLVYSVMAKHVNPSLRVTDATRVSFTSDIYPILKRASRLPWVSDTSAQGHGEGSPGDFISQMTALSSTTEPVQVRNRIFLKLRNPAGGGGDMPKLPVDDKGLPNPGLEMPSLTEVQYARMKRWAQGHFDADWPGKEPTPTPLDRLPDLEKPAALDRAALESCVGGPLFPGIEAGRVMLAETTYDKARPFRIKEQLAPGTLTESMALPWQSDFFDCGFEALEEGLEDGADWWPGQRPISVLRGGTEPVAWMPPGWHWHDLAKKWSRLGFVVEKKAAGKLTYVEEERNPDSTM